MTRARRIALAAVVALAAACGGPQTFGLTSDDNNREALGKALAMRQLPAQAGPINGTGKPMAFAVLSGAKRTLVAYDLAAGARAWAVEADVQTRVEVGRDFVVAREGKAEIVARELADGAVRWRRAVDGELVGIAADADQVYVVTAHTGRTKPAWRLAALSGRSGDEAWAEEAPGQLGTPAAQGGLVMSPFLRQWLTLLDARTGKPVTRIRGIDEEIRFARTTSDGAWFGSTAGVFRLDERASAGTRVAASYGSAKLPPQLGKATWGANGYDTVEAGYSAMDRTRILWRADGRVADGALAFQDGVVAVHYFRFVFGYTPGGELRWAYSHPRVELVASAHVGPVLAAVSARGEVVALDPATGVVRWQGALADGEAQVLGATFDADGWAPSGRVDVDPERGGTVAALVSIARDRDARFAEIKELAVAALASLPGREVTGALIAMIQDERTPQKLRETAVEVLVQRRDASSLDLYAAALATRHDYLSGARPVAVGEVARVIAGLGGAQLDGAGRAAAVDALVGQLEAPGTSSAELAQIVGALAAIGGGLELPALRRQLLAYRADPAFAGDARLVKAIVDALLASGGAVDRETVAFVAEDPRSQGAVAAYAKQALAAAAN